MSPDHEYNAVHAHNLPDPTDRWQLIKAHYGSCSWISPLTFLAAALSCHLSESVLRPQASVMLAFSDYLPLKLLLFVKVPLSMFFFFLCFDANQVHCLIKLRRNRNSLRSRWHRFTLFLPRFNRFSWINASQFDFYFNQFPKIWYSCFWSFYTVLSLLLMERIYWAPHFTILEVLYPGQCNFISN